MIIAVAAAGFCVLSASSAESNRAVVFLDADATSFWRTATNSVVTVPVDMPVLASSAELTVEGIGYRREYTITEAGDFEITLPPADSDNAENVYDMTLAFDDGTMRKARIGMVRSYSASSGEDASTRVLAPKGDRKWNAVKRRAVMPVPHGTTSLSVDGTEIGDAAANAQGWYAFSAATGDTATLALEENGRTHDASLTVYGFGHFVIIR